MGCQSRRRNFLEKAGPTEKTLFFADKTLDTSADNRNRTGFKPASSHVRSGQMNLEDMTGAFINKTKRGLLTYLPYLMELMVDGEEACVG